MRRGEWVGAVTKIGRGITHNWGRLIGGIGLLVKDGVTFLI